MTDKPAPPDLKPIQAQFCAARSLLSRGQIQKPSLKSKSAIEKQDNKDVKTGAENKKINPDRQNGATNTPDSEKAAKSSAQVARLVAPNAGGLKPDDEIGPLSGDKIDDQPDTEAYGDEPEDDESEVSNEHDWESIEQDQQDETPDTKRAEELILQRIMAEEEWEPNRPKIRTRSRRRLKRWIPLTRRYEIEAQRRPHPLGVRFSAVELEIVKAKARTVGCSVNSYIRAAALHSDYRPPRDPELTRALLMVNRELTAQGNNLNQIARQLNAGIVTSAQAESMVEFLARSLLRTHKLVRQALGFGEPEP